MHLLFAAVGQSCVTCGLKIERRPTVDRTGSESSMANKRRSSDIRVKRGTAILVEALKSGRIVHGDEDAAANTLAGSLPGIARQTRHAQLFLARACMSALPSDLIPPQVSNAIPRAVDEVPVPSQHTISNSNVMLPSIRPRASQSITPAKRKRRRLRTTPDISNDTTDSFLTKRPTARLSHLGGIDSTISIIRELTEWPLFHREIYAHLGVQPPRGILLHGPPGCGKTLLAHAVAGELGVSFLKVSGPEIVSSMSGESERKLRRLFDEARKKAPSIVFIDEIDAIASRKQGATKDMERRIVSQLISCIDDCAEGEVDKEELSKTDGDGGNSDTNPLTNENTETNKVNGIQTQIDEGDLDATKEGNIDIEQVEVDEKDLMNIDNSGRVADADETYATPDSAPFIVIAATNRPESIEPALRRAGRFDREIELGAPDEDARVAILRKLCRKLRLGDNVDFDSLAKRTAGCVGADLDLLVREAGMAAVRRFVNSVDPMDVESAGGLGHLRLSPFTTSELSNCSVGMEDLKAALESIQPSALREGFATRPDVTWADVGALENVRSELTMAVVEPVRRRGLFDAMGLRAPAGVLLYGPPGCGKTLLARAVAAESGANFISVKGPELLSRYVGDSELAVRKVFARAQASAPAVIFFDELDALAPRRGRDGGAASGASERVVNMLLTEMDGFGARRDVFLVAATNRPDIIDPAMLRPGRLDKLLYVGLPNAAGRASILRKLAKRMLIAPSVDLGVIAQDRRCEGFSGADLSALLRCGAEKALRETMANEDKSSYVTGSGSQQMEGIQDVHMEYALENVLPSVSTRDAKLYASMESKLRKSRAELADKPKDPL